MKPRVLIIDDHPTNAKLARVLLEHSGYDTRSAYSGAEAIAALESFEPEVILMDLRLPDIHGLELTQRLRADPKHAKRVIIAVTASAMKGDEALARAAGCDDYVTKPIDVHTLPALIARHLG